VCTGIICEEFGRRRRKLKLCKLIFLERKRIDGNEEWGLKISK